MLQVLHKRNSSPHWESKPQPSKHQSYMYALTTELEGEGGVVIHLLA